MTELDLETIRETELKIAEYFKLKIGHPDTHVVIESDHSLDEIGMPDIVEQVAVETNATSMTVKAKRSVVDVARRKSKDARVAMEHAFEKVHGYSGWTNNETGKLDSDVYRFCLNGVKDPTNGGYDVAIAANYNPADEDKINKMQTLLSEKLGPEYKVILAGKKTGLAIECSGFPSISDFRKEETFGKKFQTFQIGITRKLREKGPARDLVVSALIHAVREIQK